MTIAATEDNTVETQIGDCHVVASGELAEAFVDSVERPSHLAKCRECGAKVTYRPSASGNGFQVLERIGVSVEADFGIGEHGRPTCPRDHGEMTFADEQLPAAEAISQVAEQINGEAKRRLPFPAPDFNFENAFREIVSKRHDIKALEEKHDKLAERKKQVKEELDEANTDLGKMVDNFEEREQERRFEQERRARGIPDPDEPRLVKCRWEQLNPGQACPICSDSSIERKCAPGSEEHGVEARDLLVRREIEATVQQLAAVTVIVTLETLGALPIDELAEVQAWALDASQHPDERERWVASLPRGLGTPHIAAEGLTPDPDKTFEQHCATCGARLDDSGSTVYEAGALVGVDCPGAKKEPARQLPRRKKANKKK
jgi:hypothetical protein